MNAESYVSVAPRIIFNVDCPGCGNTVAADDWKMPGLWLLAQLQCPSCRRSFFYDLPYSLGVVTPCYLDRQTSEVIPRFQGQWYADLTASAWKNKAEMDVGVKVEKSDYDREICMVNCLYPWWGDAVSLLLRVNQLKESYRKGIVVVINAALRWLVPDYVAGIWVVEQDVAANARWNERLDAQIKNIVHKQDLRVKVPITFQPAYLTQEELHAACKIKPFPREEWTSRFEEKPTVTFMWRTDRTWKAPEARRPSRVGRLASRLGRTSALLHRILPGRSAVKDQQRRVSALAHELKRMFPKMEFAVCGLGRDEALPGWIKDLRVDVFEPGTNQRWAAQGAESHLVCGVTGSHLTLAGSLAGSYVELVPDDLLRNILTCASLTSREPREAVFCHRLLPIDTDPLYLARLVGAILLNYPYIAVAFQDRHYAPIAMDELHGIWDSLQARRRMLATISREVVDRFAN